MGELSLIFWCSAMANLRVQDTMAERTAVRSGNRNSAPTKKQRPPTAVPRLTSMMLRGSPVVVTIFDATADTPNAIEPARLSAAMRHEMLRMRHDHQPWLTSNHASPLATRKQIDPAMSGTHTRRWACVASRLASSAASVVTLKNTVPTNCTVLADQSMRAGSHVQKR